MINKTIVAMVCITAILIACIFNDIDGLIIGGGVAAVAGLGGWAAGKFTK